MQVGSFGPAIIDVRRACWAEDRVGEKVDAVDGDNGRGRGDVGDGDAALGQSHSG